MKVIRKGSNKKLFWNGSQQRWVSFKEAYIYSEPSPVSEDAEIISLSDAARELRELREYENRWYRRLWRVLAEIFLDK